MRIVPRVIATAALSLGALTPVTAQEATKPEAINFPASMLRYYCLAGPYVYSIGAVTCLAKGQWGTCKWTDNGSNHSAPVKRAYWVSSTAPSGSCP